MPAGTPAIIGLAYNLAALGSLIVGSALGQVSGVPAGAVEYGALGLCGFMVWQNYRVQDRLGKVIDNQHKEFVKIARETAEVITKNTTAMDACISKQAAESNR